MVDTRYAVATGEFIAEWLDENGMKQAELARRMGVSPKHVSELVSGKAVLTPQIAERLELVTNVPGRIWLSYEMTYRSDLARLAKDKELEKEAARVKEFPVDYLRRRGRVIASADDKVGMARDILSFFGVADWDALTRDDFQLVAGFRKSTAFEPSTCAISAWIREGQLQAREHVLPDYDSEAFLASIPSLRRHLSKADGLDRIRDEAAGFGVLVLFDKGPEKTRCSGVSHWAGSRPVVQVTDRGKTHDKIAFTLFHEFGHVLLHQSNREIVIQSEGRKPALTADEAIRENQADEFARNAIISPADWASRPGGLKLAPYAAFAGRIGVHPGIVIGREQFERSQYRWGNDYKAKVEFDA